MLEIKNLHASIHGKEILKGIDLTVKPGEVHAIMGPNGSGKSTLSNVLVGHPAYQVTQGSATFYGKDLLALSPEDRSHEGLFLSFQYPVEIPGVSMTNFMRAAINEHRKYHQLPPLNASEFLKLMKEKRAIVAFHRGNAHMRHFAIGNAHRAFHLRCEAARPRTEHQRRIRNGRHPRADRVRRLNDLPLVVLHVHLLLNHVFLYPIVAPAAALVNRPGGFGP